MAEPLDGRVLAALLLAVFTVALAYGMALPLLPLLIERAFGPGADIGLHTGLIAGSYAFALFLFASIWGRWSDRIGRARVLCLGLFGLSAAMAIGAALPGPPGLYLSRILGGAFAASVIPVSQALVADIVEEHNARARFISWLGTASIAGLLAGPIIGGAAGALLDTDLDSIVLVQGGLSLVAASAGLLGAAWLPSHQARAEPHDSPPFHRKQLATLVLISSLVAAGLGAFEVGLTVRGRSGPMTNGQLGMLFAECMLVMAAAQALVFNPWVKAISTSRLLAPNLLLLGLGLLLLPWANGIPGLILGTAAIAASAGILLPTLAFWITLGAGSLQGQQLGRQTSLASLGQAIGSALAGLFAGTPSELNGGILLTGASLTLAAIWQLPRLPQRLRILARASEGPSSA